MKRIVFFLAICVCGNLAAQPLTLATYQYAANNRLQNIQPLATHLEAVTGRKVAVKSYPTVHAFIAGIQNNEVDIALINTFGYLLLQASATPHAMQPRLALTVAPDTAGNYKTAIVAPAASPIQSLNDVAAHAARTRLMLVAPGSTSGNLVPRLALSGAGVPDAEAAFKQVVYGGNHAAVMDSAAAGVAGLAAIGNTTYNDFTAQPGNSGRVQLVWLSPEIPLGPVLLHNRLPKKLQRRITRALLQLHVQNPAALQRVKDGWSEAKNALRYFTISDRYYNPFRQQLGAPQHVKRILEQFAN